ncbi:MAG: LysM peptidoglycan-binding domain-containing protein [Caldilineaceae bacterium]|nr:LysM peptidoglycan-binding domain-containing protein [Caldilineaceae bacterium]
MTDHSPCHFPYSVMQSAAARMMLIALTTIALLSMARPARAQSAVHTVAPGDTLSEIAQQYGTDMDTLIALNGLSNPRHIWVGQQLRLPAQAIWRASESAAYGGATDAYSVQPGDTLSGIAAARGVSLQELAAMNGLPPLTRVVIGQWLTVPAGGDEIDAADTATAYAAAGMAGNEQLHVVGPGESLGSIAQLYGVASAAIAQRNGIANPSLITVGQRLVVPNAAQVIASGVYAQGFPGNVAFPPTGGKWIEVDLSRQQVTAYAGAAVQQVFLISSGAAATPTVIGTFQIETKLTEQTMTGGSEAAGTAYRLPNVPWVQYFYQDYAFHGAYWHNSFGTPLSNGCINMRIADAQWLFDWAGYGTMVIVHE